MKILERTKQYLSKSQVSQTELAKQLGIGLPALNRLLKGHSGKVSIALKLDAFLEENGFPHDLKVTEEQDREEQ